MTPLKGTIKLVVPALLLAAATVCAAAGKSHPAILAGARCVATQCHEGLLAAAGEAQDGSVHQPASGGDCAACHDIAGSAAAGFVTAAPADGSDGPGRARAWDLALCVACHGEGLLASPATATGFREGKRNLHALHVQAGRGRRCLTCHDPHAARQPKLLRARIAAGGGARIAQEFRGRPQGGWCRTGCHAPKAYAR